MAILLGILVVQYIRALGPSAQDDRFAACRALNPAPFNPAIGRLPVVAPDFEAQDFTSNMVKLGAYRGRVVFLNFWQHDCAPCKEEMPSMERLQKKLGEDMTVLALASETSWTPIRAFFAGGTNMTILLDPPETTHPAGKIARRYGTEKWPETYLIDKQGVVRYYYINSRRWDSDNAVECVRSLLAE
jgi:peroxiredoxin